MALYEYECKLNGHRFEVRHGMNESPVHSCLECSADVRRVITAPAILFKGGGFYVTDSRATSEAVSESKLPSEGGESKPNAGPTKSVAPNASRDAAAVS